MSTTTQLKKTISKMKQPTLSFFTHKDTSAPLCTEDELHKLQIRTKREKKQKVVHDIQTEQNESTNKRIQVLLRKKIEEWMQTRCSFIGIDDFITELTTPGPYVVKYSPREASFNRPPFSEVRKLQRIGATFNEEKKLWEVHTRCDFACVIRNCPDWIPHVLMNCAKANHIDLASLVDYADQQWQIISESVHLSNGTTSSAMIEADQTINSIESFEELVNNIRLKQLHNQVRIELQVPSNTPGELDRLKELQIPPDACDIFDGLRKLGPHASCSNATRLLRGLRWSIINTDDIRKAYDWLQRSPKEYEDVMDWLELR